MSTLARVENSTNVRNGMPPGLRFASLVTAAAAAIGPEAAAAVAERFFRTARRRPRPASERGLLAAASPHALELDGKPLAAWTWGEGPTILLVHGWEGRGAQLGALVRPAVSAGFRVMAFDAPAHGDSPGTRTSLVELSRAIAAAERAAGGLFGIVAHSFGAAATTIALARGTRVERAVYIAPVVEVARTVDEFAHVLGLDVEATACFHRRLAEVNGASPTDLDGTKLAKGVTAPLLIVHDARDTRVKPRGAKSLAAAWRGGAELICTTGLGHYRVLHDRFVVDAAVSFLRGAPVSTRRPSEEEELVLDLFDRERRWASQPPLP